MKKETEKKIRILGRIFFGIYICILVYFMFFSEEWGRKIFGGEYHYNLVPFREISRYLHYWRKIGGWRVLWNLAGNIIGFIPFGSLLPILREKKLGFFKVFLLSFELSLLIEISQLVLRTGSCDVDDLILNTLGGCIGYFIYYYMKRMKENYFEKKV